MNAHSKLATYLLTALLALSAATSNAAEQMPATGTPLTLPMTDGTKANAIFLPAPNGALYLIYSTPTTPLGFWTLTPNQITPPQPPQPTTTVARVITVTQLTPAALPAAVQNYLTTNGATYSAYTIAQVATPQPDPDALKWIGQAAPHPCPWTFVLNAQGNTIAQGPTPTTDTAFLAMLGAPQTTKTAPAAPAQLTAPCPPGCNCQPPPQLKRSRPR